MGAKPSREVHSTHMCGRQVFNRSLGISGVAVVPQAGSHRIVSRTLLVHTPCLIDVESEDGVYIPCGEWEDLCMTKLHIGAQSSELLVELYIRLPKVSFKFTCCVPGCRAMFLAKLFRPVPE